MIHNDEIEKKDFGGALYRKAYKLKSVSEALYNRGMEVDPCVQDALTGFSYILDDVANDLETISNALYYPNELKRETTEGCEIIRKLEENR